MQFSNTLTQDHSSEFRFNQRPKIEKEDFFDTYLYVLIMHIRLNVLYIYAERNNRRHYNHRNYLKIVTTILRLEPLKSRRKFSENTSGK